MPGTLDNKYLVSRTLGSGSFCKVKLGKLMKNGQKVAIKFMKSPEELLSKES